MRFVKGHKPIPLTDKGRQIMSQKIKQAWKDGRMKVVAGHTGKKHSEETKKRLSEHFKKNPVSYWKGKKRPSPSLETRRKVSEALKGEKSYCWRGGVYQPNNLIRRSLDYRIWRMSVFQRDNFTCVFCGIRGGKLNADHIKPFALFPELRFAIDNGRTLCIPCHRKTDTWGWRTANKNVQA